jgi:hypothetical protein
MASKDLLKNAPVIHRYHSIRLNLRKNAENSISIESSEVQAELENGDPIPLDQPKGFWIKEEKNHFALAWLLVAHRRALTKPRSEIEGSTLARDAFAKALHDALRGAVWSCLAYGKKIPDQKSTLKLNDFYTFRSSPQALLLAPIGENWLDSEQLQIYLDSRPAVVEADLLAVESLLLTKWNSFGAPVVTSPQPEPLMQPQPLAPLQTPAEPPVTTSLGSTSQNAGKHTPHRWLVGLGAALLVFGSIAWMWFQLHQSTPRDARAAEIPPPEKILTVDEFDKEPVLSKERPPAEQKPWLIQTQIEGGRRDLNSHGPTPWVDERITARLTARDQLQVRVKKIYQGNARNGPNLDTYFGFWYNIPASFSRPHKVIVDISRVELTNEKHPSSPRISIELKKKGDKRPLRIIDLWTADDPNRGPLHLSCPIDPGIDFDEVCIEFENALPEDAVTFDRVAFAVPG